MYQIYYISNGIVLVLKSPSLRNALPILPKCQKIFSGLFIRKDKVAPRDVKMNNITSQYFQDLRNMWN